jgi:hypothetical protein
VTLIRLVVTIACETWTLYGTSIIYERQTLRKKFGPNRSEKGWRIRSTNKLQRLIKEEDIVKRIQATKNKWWGHLNRMEHICIAAMFLIITICHTEFVHTKYRMPRFLIITIKLKAKCMFHSTSFCFILFKKFSLIKIIIIFLRSMYST